MLHCNQCGSDWESRVVDPVQCPRCKRVDWREDKKGKVDVQRNVEIGNKVIGNVDAPVVRRVRLDVGENSHRKGSHQNETISPAAVSTGNASAPEFDRETGRTCVSCEGSLTEVKGKLFCPDQGCGMYGQEQKGKR